MATMTISKTRKGFTTINIKAGKGECLLKVVEALAAKSDAPPHPTLTNEAKARRSAALDELGALDGELLG